MKTRNRAPRTGSGKALPAFLADPRSYPHRPRRVRIVQTHASWVALAGSLVYKVKKPVNLGFLDFSTLARRHRLCEREVALNRRLCPDTYLGVEPITRRGGRLHFGGGGEIVEYAVVMRRLDPAHFLLHRLARGRSGPRDVNAVVATLKPFYQSHPPTKSISHWGRVSRIRLSTRENFRQMRSFLGDTISRGALAAIRRYTNDFLRAQEELFRSRLREHRIRDCHGDLHLEHIHLGPRGVAIYDCIEFNDRFRYIDIANDVAFLAMDFDFHERPDLADHLAARLGRALRDPAMARLLNFYKCYRACVRGKVESMRASARGVPVREQREGREHARRYFRLALRYAVGGDAPCLLAVIGRVGTGKSTLARALGHELGWPVESSDRLRKQLARIPLRRRGSAEQRSRLYAKPMTDRTYAELVRRALGAMKAGGGVVLDATFGSRRQRDRLRRAAKRAGARCVFVEARASDRVIRQRLAARGHSRGEISDARLEDWQRLARTYERPGEIPIAQLVAAGTGQDPQRLLAAVLTKLAARSAAA